MTLGQLGVALVVRIFHEVWIGSKPYRVASYNGDRPRPQARARTAARSTYTLG
jgi:hypothetical protein